MTVKRPYSSAIFAAALILLSTATCVPGLDAQQTSAIPLAGVEDDASSIEALKSGLDALAAGNVEAARSIRDGLLLISTEK